MKHYARDDGNTVRFGTSGDRPTVQYGDGPEHVLLNESHANAVRDTIILAGYKVVTGDA